MDSNENETLHNQHKHVHIPNEKLLPPSLKAGVRNKALYKVKKQSFENSEDYEVRELVNGMPDAPCSFANSVERNRTASRRPVKSRLIKKPNQLVRPKRTVIHSSLDARHNEISEEQPVSKGRATFIKVGDDLEVNNTIELNNTIQRRHMSLK